MTSQESPESDGTHSGATDEVYASAISPEELRKIARGCDVLAKFRIASSESMPPDAIHMLAFDGDPEVRRSVLVNHRVPQAVLLKMLERFPELNQQIRVHPNAPRELAESAPLSDHSTLSILTYLDAREASIEQRDAVVEMFNARQSLTLGQAWESVT